MIWLNEVNEVIKAYAVNQETRFDVVNWVNGVIGVYGGNQVQRVNGPDEIDCVSEMNKFNGRELDEWDKFGGWDELCEWGELIE